MMSHNQLVPPNGEGDNVVVTPQDQEEAEEMKEKLIIKSALPVFEN